jgi:hypothetical protein
MTTCCAVSVRARPSDRGGGGAQGGQVTAAVHRQVAGGEDAARRVRGEEGLQPAALPGVEALGAQADTVAEVGEAVERGQVPAVVGHREGALGAQAGCLPGGSFQFRVEAGEPLDRVQVEVQQVLLAEHGLGDRGQHPRRDQACLVVRLRVVATWVDERHALAGAASPPGDSGADHTAAHDDDVHPGAMRGDLVQGNGHACSLRRHYPDQVRRSEADRLPLSPPSGSRAC